MQEATDCRQRHANVLSHSPLVGKAIAPDDLTFSMHSLRTLIDRGNRIHDRHIQQSAFNINVLVLAIAASIYNL